MTLLARASLVVAALFAVSLVACGDGEAGDETPTPTATSTATPGPETGAGAPPTATGSPDGSSGPQTYEVVAGDTIFDIAAEFGVDAGELMSANGITDPTLLQIGQILAIPSGDAPPAGTPQGTATSTATATPGG